jgi:hypothetical protein
MAERARCTPWLALALAGAALAGCATEAKKRDAELTQLLGWLPGSYENTAQANSASPPRARVALLVAKVYTPRLGHHVLFAQETAADDPRRVMSGHIFSFKVDDKRGILESVYTFAEPLRWRDGPEHLDLFTGVVAEDVLSVPGCELVWKKDGERFTAATDPKLCHDSSAAAVTAELSSDSLDLAGYHFRKTH